MRILVGVVKFLWDFVVGDDPAAALGVVLLLAGSAILVHLGADVWWLIPLGVMTILAVTLRRATRSS